jgi:MoaA/NifB/PqqE/SkfB family radical SAM enzyme
VIELLAKIGYRPRFCVWELTLACNLRCLHCGSYAGDQRKRELSLQESFDIADQLAQLGCEKVTLGGGEPTLNPHWHEIGLRLSDAGVRVNIISNGWRWGDQEIERTRAAKLTNVAFSLDGFQEAHDTQRREGSFERVVAAIDRTHAAGIPVSIITTLNTLNAQYLPEFRDFLAERHIASWQLQLGIPSGTMSHYKEELVLSPESLLTLIPTIAELRNDAVKRPIVFPSDNIGYFGRYEKQLRDRGAPISFWLGCRAGLQVPLATLE